MIRALLVALLFVVAPALAQEKTLTILVGAAAGSPEDAIARALAGKLKPAIGMNVVIENKPGAGGHAAAEALRAATADGTTLLIAPETLVCLYPATGKEFGFNAFRDFVPVSQVAKSPYVLAVGKAVPAKDIKEYLKWLAANPGKNGFGSPVNGAPPQFFGLAIAESAGVKLTHVPYADSAALMADLASGKLVAAVDTLANVLADHRAGKVRILAVSGKQRSGLVPGVPTFGEEGLKDPLAFGWIGFFTPWNTPKITVERLSGSIKAALKAPEAQAQLAKLGLESVGTHSWELREIARADYARWSDAAKAAGYAPMDMPNRIIN